jgi:alpha-1,3-mannosyltransferase
MIILSKRLHSIFVLRLFNDGFAVFFLWAAIFFFQRKNWQLGCLIYSLGLGTKMSLLLPLPAVGAVLYLSRGLREGLQYAAMIAILQFLAAIPFLISDATAYLSNSFQFSRKFMYEWTVNWRFVGEHIFSSNEFALALMAGHVGTLYLFLTTRWLRPAGRSMFRLISAALYFEEPFNVKLISVRITPTYIQTAILSSTAIGLLFARSLHYQFYVYVALSTPYLLWRAKFHPLLQYFLWGLQEWAWNVYPSTDLSSRVVIGVQLMILVGVWIGTFSKNGDLLALDVDEVSANQVVQPRGRRRKRI